MSTNFPVSVDTSVTLPAEGAAVPLATNHVTAHQNLQDAVEAIEAKIGVDSSAVTTSHDYKLGEILTTDKAVGKTATQTLTNKTLTSPVVNVGSDATGDMYYRNAGVLTRIPAGTDNYILKLNGTTPNWEQETAQDTTLYSPTGMISPYAGATAPTSWLLCDGSAVSRTTYAALFAITSTTYGVGDGSTTFNVPDLRGRVAVGKSADTEFDVLGETGGEKTHTLTETEMPAHSHTLNTATGGGGGSYTFLNLAVSTSTNYSTPYTLPKDNGTTVLGITNTGSGTAHNNLQPYITLNYIIKI